MNYTDIFSKLHVERDKAVARHQRGDVAVAGNTITIPWDTYRQNSVIRFRKRMREYPCVSGVFFSYNGTGGGSVVIHINGYDDVDHRIMGNLMEYCGLTKPEAESVINTLMPAQIWEKYGMGEFCARPCEHCGRWIESGFMVEWGGATTFRYFCDPDHAKAAGIPKRDLSGYLRDGDDSTCWTEWG